mmetsp:Transcript_89864/g.259015  ORF Transcript_89864/g.259015 Transcript_89864/m.259015 type:complete len:213 (+) Transcript_89864:310-948(+)
MVACAPSASTSAAGGALPQGRAQSPGWCAWATAWTSWKGVLRVTPAYFEGSKRAPSSTIQETSRWHISPGCASRQKSECVTFVVAAGSMSKRLVASIDADRSSRAPETMADATSAATLAEMPMVAATLRTNMAALLREKAAAGSVRVAFAAAVGVGATGIRSSLPVFTAPAPGSSTTADNFAGDAAGPFVIAVSGGGDKRPSCGRMRGPKKA